MRKGGAIGGARASVNPSRKHSTLNSTSLHHRTSRSDGRPRCFLYQTAIGRPWVRGGWVSILAAQHASPPPPCGREGTGGSPQKTTDHTGHEGSPPPLAHLLALVRRHKRALLPPSSSLLLFTTRKSVIISSESLAAPATPLPTQHPITFPK